MRLLIRCGNDILDISEVVALVDTHCGGKTRG